MTTTYAAPPDRATGPPAIELRALTKRYGRRTAVDALDLDLPAGGIVGFLGPNGAGKTTTMAMLLGLVRPTAGEGAVLGHPLDHPEAYLGRVGALVEEPAHYRGLTGRENLRMLARLTGRDESTIDDLLAVVGLEERGDDRFGRYSMGMRQRLGIAAALLGDPELLILDEPANGLDPAGMREMWQLVAGLGGRRTVLVSSHVLRELEDVCDRLVVIDRGVLRFNGPIADLLGGPPPLVLVPERPSDVPRLVRLVEEEGHDAQEGEDHESVVVALAFAPVPMGVLAGRPSNRADAARLNRRAHEEGIALAELAARRQSLESRYLDLVEGGTR